MFGSAKQNTRPTRLSSITVEKETQVDVEETVDVCVDVEVTIDDLEDGIVFDYIDKKLTVEQLFEGLSERDQYDLYEFLKMRGRI